MIRTRLMLAAAGTALLLSAPAFAQSRAHPTAMIYFSMADGHVMSMDAPSADKVDMLMKVAKKLPAGTIVYTSDGALWIAQDSKMADGKMMSDSLMH